MGLRAKTKCNSFFLALRASSKWLFITEIINLVANLQLFNEAFLEKIWRYAPFLNISMNLKKNV